MSGGRRQIQVEEVHLPLNIGLIRLDLDSDGKGSDKEALWRVFAAVTGSQRWLDESVAEELLTDFDGSDVPWLRAYCHLLMAIAEFPLAHDWQRAFDSTFPSIFHIPDSAAGRKINDALVEARARFAEIGPPPSKPPDMDWRYWQFTPQYREAKRIYALRRRYGYPIVYGSIADLIAFVHLLHGPSWNASV